MHSARAPRPRRPGGGGGGRTGACLAAPAAAMAGETPTMAPPQATRLPPPSPFFSGVRLLATLCAVGAGVMYDWRAHNGGKDHVLQPLQNVILGLGDFVRAARGAQGREREGVCASLRACTRMRAMHTRTRSCARAFARTLTHTHTPTHVARACTNATLPHSRTYAHACTRAQVMGRTPPASPGGANAVGAIAIANDDNGAATAASTPGGRRGA